MLKPAILTTLVSTCALAAAACSATSKGDDPTSEDALMTKSAICAFPTRTHERPIADHYVTWQSEEQREAYLVAYLPVMGLRRSTNTSAVPALQAAVDELFPSIRAELPAETEGMTFAPTVVLLDDPIPNAFAANDPRESPARAPWLLFVNEGLLTLDASESEVHGVMAHELAHLMAKHQFPDSAARVRRHYQIGERDESSIVASLERDDSTVHAFADRFESLVSYGGAFDVPALKGFTVRYSGLTKPIKYHTYFEMMGRVPTDECAEHATKYAAMQSALRNHLSKFDHQMRVEGPAVVEMEAMATASADAARACAASAAITLVALAVQLELELNPSLQSDLEAAATEGPDALRRKVLDSDEIAVDDQDADVVTKLFELGKQKRARLAAHVASAGGVATMRRYGEEVEADQIAVRVLRHAGVEPTGGAGFLLRSLDGDARQKCDAVLAAGEVPPFGGFSFLHPATCWRVYQARLFAKQLAVCSSPAPER